jgi:hypothetical protein
VPTVGLGGNAPIGLQPDLSSASDVTGGANWSWVTVSPGLSEP